MTDPLRARLTALIENWHQRERQYQNLRPHDEATADTYRGCAAELAALLREPPEAGASYQTVATMSVDADCANYGCQLALPTGSSMKRGR